MPQISSDYVRSLLRATKQMRAELRWYEWVAKIYLLGAIRVLESLLTKEV